jgi:hypothetical protein
MERPRTSMRPALARLLQVAVILVAAGLALADFVALDAASHSVSDTLRPWLIGTALLACTTVLLVRSIGRFR